LNGLSSVLCRIRTDCFQEVNPSVSAEMEVSLRLRKPC